MTETKALARFEMKAADDQTRTFEGLASTWDLDLGGDVIHKGAFAKTLRDWKSSGRVIPLIDQHNYFSVRSVLGKLVDARETDEGLWTKWKVTEGQDGDELLHRLRGGMVDGLSIGYETVSSEPETRAGVTVRHLKEVRLLEVSAVIWGMNPNALITRGSVKSLLDPLDPAQLNDEDKRELRALASRIGSLLRPTDPAGKAAAPEVPEDDPSPDASPAPAADTHEGTTTEEQPPQAADTPQETTEGKATADTYAYSDALMQRLLALKIKRATTGV